MDFDFHPYNKPSMKGKIILPEDNRKFAKKYSSKKYYIETEEFKDIDINLEKLSGGRSIDEDSYNLEELKDFAKQLNIDKFSTMNKKDLVKNIKLKLKQI